MVGLVHDDLALGAIAVAQKVLQLLELRRRAEILRVGAQPVEQALRELLADDTAVSGGSARNASHAAEFANFAADVEPARRRLVTDAMTSGGLLAALPAARAAEVPGAVVGRLVDGPAGAISVRG